MPKLSLCPLNLFSFFNCRLNQDQNQAPETGANYQTARPGEDLNINSQLIAINNMVITNLTVKKVLLHLLKDYSNTHTVTSLAKELGISRVGMWKMLKRLGKNKYLLLTAVGTGKTSAAVITLNWEHPLLEKTLSFYLTEEALKQRRWQVNFIGLEQLNLFVIMYGSILNHPQQANDIDILGVANKNNFVKVQKVIDQVQKIQSKKIHSINFTVNELKLELKKSNLAIRGAIRTGVVLFGQENFIKFMKEMAT